MNYDQKICLVILDTLATHNMIDAYNIMNAPTHISANIVSLIYVCIIEFDTHINSFLRGYIVLWRMYEIIFLLFNTEQMFIWISDVRILNFLNNVRFFFY